MAINKNFVIKNGLEVNTNVLVAASDESQVGVGTTRPYYKLHVGGGEGNRGGIGATDITITGIATIGVANSDSGAFNVLGISTFKGDIDLIGSAGISTVRWDASKDGLIFQDNATARFGTGEDLRIWHDGSNSYISDQGTGSLIIYGTDETLAVFTDDGSVQLYNNDSKKIETTGLGITVYGDSIVSGVTTTARLNVTGISTFVDDVDFDSKIRFDESESALTFIDNAAIRVGTGSDFSIMHDGTQTILTTQGGTKPLHIKADPIHFIKAGSTEEYYAKFTADNAVELYFDNTHRFSTTAIGATVFGDFIASGVGTFANLKVAGIATADRFIGIHTSADGGGIGIGSTTAHVGYGITYIDFKGPGVSTVYSSSVTGITTIYFQGGGSNTGAAGTWQNDGSQGISTAKSVGINTVGVAVTALMGGEKGASSGIGASMQGLYIGNGMMINDNQLNGNHYIGTAFGGIMAGPVTVNGVVTVDGNWAVV